MVLMGPSVSCTYTKVRKQRHHKLMTSPQYLTGVSIGQREPRTEQVTDGGKEADGDKEADGSSMA